jgi:hypothetical protein
MFHNSAKTYLTYDVVHIVILTYYTASYDAFVNELRISYARFSCTSFSHKIEHFRNLFPEMAIWKISSKGIRHLESGQNRAWHSIPNWNRRIRNHCLQITNDIEYRTGNQESGIKNPNLELSLILKTIQVLQYLAGSWNVEFQKQYKVIEQL